MTYINDDVEAAIYDNDDTVPDMAEAAIAAATPHIRAALFDELIDKLSHPRECRVWDIEGIYCMDGEFVHWLEVQKESQP